MSHYLHCRSLLGGIARRTGLRSPDHPGAGPAWTHARPVRRTYTAHRSLIDVTDLIDLSHAPSRTVYASNSSDHPDSNRPDAAVDDTKQQASGSETPAGLDELTRFDSLLKVLEEGLARHGPIDPTRLTKFARAWRKHTPDDVVKRISPGEEREFFQDVDAMTTHETPDSPPLSAGAPMSKAGHSGSDTLTSGLGPDELPLETLTTNAAHASHPSVEQGPTSASESDARPTSKPFNVWQPLMQDLLRNLPTAPHATGPKSPSPHPRGPSGARSYSTRAASKRPVSRYAHGAPTSLLEPLPNADLILKENLSVYYPEELYAKVQAPISPTEALRQRQAQSVVTGAPVPSDHPLISRNATRLTPLTADPATESTTAAVEPASVENEPEDVGLASNLAPDLGDISLEAGKASSLTVSLPLYPGDLVEIFDTRGAAPRFGIVLAALLPDAHSGRYQVLTDGQVILTIHDYQVSFWAPNFLFSQPAVLETCWRFHIRSIGAYHVNLSTTEARQARGLTPREVTQRLLDPKLNQQKRGYIKAHLKEDLARAVPDSNNLVPAIPMLRGVLSDWRARVDELRWRHHFQLDKLYDYAQSNPSVAQLYGGGSSGTECQTEAELAWDESTWESRAHLTVEHVAHLMFSDSARGVALANPNARLATIKPLTSDKEPLKKNKKHKKGRVEALPPSKLTVEELYMVHRHLYTSPIDFVPDQRSLALTRRYYPRPPVERATILDIQHWVRERTPEFDRFQTTTRRILAAREGTSVETDGGDSTKGPLAFEGTDAQIIHLFKNYVADHVRGIQCSTGYYDSLVPALLKPLRRYTPIDQDAVVQFLMDVGVWNPGENTHVLNRTLPLPHTGLFPKVDKLEQDLLKSIKQDLRSVVATGPAGAVRDRVDLTLSSPHHLYDHDLYADIRRDFGTLPVYTIDDATAHEIDDGVSLERDPLTGQPTWLHVHIADPTTLIPPDHPMTSYLGLRQTTLYFTEAAVPMIPGDLASLGLGLGQGRKTPGDPTRSGGGSAAQSYPPHPCLSNADGQLALTFSARVDSQGQIMEYQIAPSRLHNIQSLTYHQVDAVLARIPGAGSRFQAAGGKTIPTDPFLPVSSWPTVWHPGATSAAATRELPAGLEAALSRFTASGANTPLDATTTTTTAATRDLTDLLQIARQLHSQRVQNGALVSNLPVTQVQVGPSPLTPSAYPALIGTANAKRPLPRFEVAPSSSSSCSSVAASVGTTNQPWIAVQTNADPLSPSRQLVAETMMLAGQVAARFCTERQIPIIYRNQGRPNFSKLERIERATERLLNLDVVRGAAQRRKVIEPSPISASHRGPSAGGSSRSLGEFYEDTLARARENHGTLDLRRFANLLPFVPTAFDSPHRVGHAMAGITDGYTRVTSPLRRFIDMVTHWQIKAYLRFGSVDRLPFTERDLSTAVAEWSRTERAARITTRARQVTWQATLLQRWLDRYPDEWMTAEAASMMDNATNPEVAKSAAAGAPKPTDADTIVWGDGPTTCKQARSPFIRDSLGNPLLQGYVALPRMSPNAPVLVYVPVVGLTFSVKASDVCRPASRATSPGQFGGLAPGTGSPVSYSWDLVAKPLLVGDRVLLRALQIRPHVQQFTAEIVEVEQLPDAE